MHTLDSGCVLPLWLLLPEAFLLPPPLLMTIRDVNAVYSIDIKTTPCRLFVFCFCLTEKPTKHRIITFKVITNALKVCPVPVVTCVPGLLI